MNLTQLAKLLGGQGTPVEGCNLSAQEAVLTAQERFNPRPFCLVSEWKMLDLEISTDELNALHARDLAPVIVYAPCVVLDSSGRFQPGDWVRTSFQSRYEAPGFFLTRNTVYILLGRGSRQNITVDELNAFTAH
ncbi:DUF6957 family protein [Pseudomonas asplenii]|uniref:DUF6957 domain-containing protein n=1 Tax=Pseudomonas asplenii TaxID=53407 RepID=A0A1H6LGV8_9PSED|nr:hypothetical protein [Pseudomonas fuscovaginae]SEH85303.1 hypothetical protein SAMN05216581_0135 [Pseudomonas fuscovaginae]